MLAVTAAIRTIVATGGQVIGPIADKMVVALAVKIV